MKRILFFGLLFFVTKLQSQTYNFRNYSVQNGLPFISVSALFQDHDGYLWCGGYGGLSKFDGKVFANFSPKTGLVNSSVNAIIEDKNDNLWIGTIGGLSCYHNGSFVNYSAYDGIPGNYINCLLADSRNRIWVGTKKGLCYRENIKFKPCSTESLKGKKVNCLYEDVKKNIWVGTDHGLWCLTNSDTSNFSILNGLNSNKINAICGNDKGLIYIGTDEGLNIYENGTFQTTLISKDKISSLVFDGKNLWIGTEHGLVRLNNGIKYYSLRKDLNSNLITSLHLDRESNLWIGTFSGVFRFRDEDFISYTEEEGLQSNFIFQVLEDSKGRMWVTSKAGLHEFSNGYFVPSTLNKNFGAANAIIEDKDNRLWLGTDSGVFCISNQSQKRFSESDGLLSNNIFSVLEDRKGSFWFGGTNGVSKYDGKKIINYRLTDEEGFVSSIFEDKDGVIWCAAYQGGLFKFDGKRFENYSDLLDIKTNSFLSIQQDIRGNMVFGTFDGLYIYTGKQVKHLGMKEGMTSELVYSTFYDKSKDLLWLGTNQGVNEIELGKYFKSGNPSIKHFSQEEGFSGIECNSNGIIQDKAGNLWFSTVSGLIKYNPAQVRENLNEPLTKITRVLIHNQEIGVKDKLDLTYEQNNLTFNYIGISLTNPEEVKYKYKLVGFDKDWSEEVKYSFAKYSNLPPGNYTFQVRSCNAENVWNVKPAEMSFVIAPPFWKTWAFGLSSFSIIAFSTVAGIRYRLKHIRLKERRLGEHKVQLAQMEMKALRAQMNPHFIFNCLNSIQHFIMKNDEEAATRYLNKFSRLIRTTLNNSEKQFITISEELDYLKLYLELEQLRFEGRFEYEFVVDKNLDSQGFEMPPLLIQPYVENALLHGLLPKKVGGKLLIDLSIEDSSMVCVVTDNGIGRKAAQKKSNNSLHSSLGMKITNDRVDVINKLYNLSLQVSIEDLYEEKDIASGTRVRFKIPLRND